MLSSYRPKLLYHFHLMLFRSFRFLPHFRYIYTDEAKLYIRSLWETMELSTQPELDGNIGNM